MGHTLGERKNNESDTFICQESERMRSERNNFHSSSLSPNCLSVTLKMNLEREQIQFTGHRYICRSSACSCSLLARVSTKYHLVES